MPNTPALILVTRIEWNNFFIAFILAMFFALGLRSVVLLIADRGRGTLLALLRVAETAIFLALGWLYALFAAPIMMWDRVPRAIAATTLVVVLLSVAIRRARNRPAPPGPANEI